MERHITHLIYKHLIGTATADEESRLNEWAAGHPDRERMLARVKQPDYAARQLMRRELVPVARPLADMRRRIREAEAPARRRRYMAVAASVAIFILSVAAVYIYNIGGNLSLENGSEEMIAETIVIDENRSLDEITPGTAKARLIVPGGQAIELCPADTARLNVNKIMTQIPANGEHVHQLCLDVPRGGEFKIVLEDSTVVWLNSQSTLRYPEAFGDKERRVQIKGEAYFAVHHDENRPFYVETEGHTIRVYGTSFNVRAYADDPCVYTTLEEGSISISRRGKKSGEVMLSPGHQALLDHTGENMKVRRVDTSAITGWRHGRFVFEEQPLSAIMRDLSRWYNVSFSFSDPELEDIVFMGSIPRYTDLATALAVIEKSGGLAFNLDTTGKVIVSRR